MDEVKKTKEDAIRRISWDEFRNYGMLWFVNRILHTFGLVLVYSVEDGKITEVYPARTSFRGFPQSTDCRGYINVSKYMEENASELLKEAKE